jgi:hypothetical protein
MAYSLKVEIGYARNLFSAFFKLSGEGEEGVTGNT